MSRGEGGQVVEGEEETLDVGHVGEGTRRKKLDPVLAQPETCERVESFPHVSMDISQMIGSQIKNAQDSSET